jgi:hypothetical protein
MPVLNVGSSQTSSIHAVSNGLRRPDSAQSAASSSSGFESFLAGFEQARQARASNASSNNSNQPVNSAQNGQNLPKMSQNQNQQKNSGSDPMQLLMAQLLAQSTLGQLTSANPSPSSIASTSAGTADGANVGGMGSIQDILARLGVSNPSLSSQLGGGAQNSLMNLALLKALSASGQASGSNTGSATDLNSVLQALQGLSSGSKDALASALQSQNLGSSNNSLLSTLQAQLANSSDPASQDLAKKLDSLIQVGQGGVQAQLDAFAKANQTGPIKLLGIQSSVAAPLTGALQNLTSAKKIDGASLASIKNAKGGNLINANPDGFAKSFFARQNQMIGNPAAPNELSASSQGTNDASQSAESFKSIIQDKPLSGGQDLNQNSAALNLTASQAQQNLSASSGEKMQIAASDLSLTQGALHSHLLNSAKAGGGRVQLELTPPEQGTIRIDLRIGQNGEAHLIVEGANDAAKARLDQGGQNLKNEFAQMGLNLSLNLNGGNSFAQAREQAMTQMPQQNTLGKAISEQNAANGSNLPNLSITSDNRVANNQIHLYA